MSDQRPTITPPPGTATEIYLYIIMREIEALRTVTSALYELVHQHQPPGQVELKEPTSPKPKRKHRDAEPAAEPATGRPAGSSE